MRNAIEYTAGEARLIGQALKRTVIITSALSAAVLVVLVAVGVRDQARSCEYFCLNVGWALYLGGVVWVTYTLVAATVTTILALLLARSSAPLLPVSVVGGVVLPIAAAAVVLAITLT